MSLSLKSACFILRMVLCHIPFFNFIFKVDIPILPSPGIKSVFVINDQGNSNKKKIT